VFKTYGGISFQILAKITSRLSLQKLARRQLLMLKVLSQLRAFKPCGGMCYQKIYNIAYTLFSKLHDLADQDDIYLEVSV
jgi:hypothetical protein